MLLSPAALLPFALQFLAEQIKHRISPGGLKHLSEHINLSNTYMNMHGNS
jgi:hypothetical protein